MQRGARHRRLTQGKAGHQARRAQPQTGLGQQRGDLGSRKQGDKLAQPEITGIEQIRARLAGSGTQQIEQLAQLHPRQITPARV